MEKSIEEQVKEEIAYYSVHGGDPKKYRQRRERQFSKNIKKTPEMAERFLWSLRFADEWAKKQDEMAAQHASK